jgi:hypothetical protein
MIELAEVLRRHWPEYQAAFGQRIPVSHRAAVHDIIRCRTPAMGGLRFGCQKCGREHFVYLSCNHRACPKCGHAETQEWIEKQKRRLLPVLYFMVTFTVPEELRSILRSHQKELYHLLFKESAATLMEVAARPKFLGADLGFMGVLHTWSRQLIFHPHIHYVVPGGGLSADGLRWVRFKNPEFFLPYKVLARRFRNRFREALRNTPLWNSVPRQVWSMDWNVECTAVGNGEPVLIYLARYVYKTALGSNAILKDENGQITFRFRHSDTGKMDRLALPAKEFIRRFLQHVLPGGFQRVRYFGWMAPAARKRFQRIRALLDWKEPEKKPPTAPAPLPICKVCGLEMVLMEELPRAP